MKKTIALTFSILLLAACANQSAAPAITGGPSLTSATQNSPSAPMPEKPAAAPYKIFMITPGPTDKTAKTAADCKETIIALDTKSQEKAAPKIEDRIKQALTELLGIKTATYGTTPAYTNALANSNLKIESITFGAGHQAIVKLTGTATPKETCDAPRMEQQLINTISQFPEIIDQTVLLNNIPLHEALNPPTKPKK